MDVKTEYLNGILKWEIYIRVPEGVKTKKKQKENVVCKLNKSLYDLKTIS